MAYNQIALMQYSTIEKELVAAAAITPGMLIERDSNNKVKAHATSQGNVAPTMFALENEAEGQGIDDAYAAADQVRVGVFNAGDEVFAILADGQNVSIGDLLESNGAGYLQKHVADIAEASAPQTIYARSIVAVALEAKDISDSSGAESSDTTVGYNKRIKVEIV